MAVVVKTTQVVGGQRRDGIAIFMSSRPVGPAQREQAQSLDRELASRMEEVTRQVRAGGWLALKRKPGVVRLWWEVGRRLREFVSDLDVGPEEDRQFLWRAMYDHAPELVPGIIGSRAERLQNSHFKYCYELGKYSWERVHAFGDWTSWTEVFDSDRIREDSRIADWLVDRVTGGHPDWNAYTDQSRMDWFRPLAKAIRSQFKNRESRGLTTDELWTELDKVFNSLRKQDA